MGERRTAMLRVARNAVLRRLALSFAGFSVAEYAVWLAVLVYAFDRGGVGESGAVAVALMMPALVVAPLASFAGDRFRPHRAMTVGYTVQALTTAITAVAMVLGAPVGAYVAAAGAMAAISFTRPVMGVLLPLTCDSPADLIAANVVMGVIANLGLFLGPLAAGAVLATGTPAMVFGGAAALLGLCAVSVASMRLPTHADEPRPRIDADSVLTEVLGGLTALRRAPNVAAILGLVAIGSFTGGMLDVMVVVFADERLGAGGGTAGLLAAAVGLGALLGSGAALGVIGGNRLMPYFMLSGVLMGAPLLVLAATDATFVAVMTLVATGVGAGLLTVIGTLAIQRRSPVRYRGRIFGALEGLETLALALGALAIAALVDSVGLDQALVVLGLAVMAVMTIGSGLYLVVAGDVRSPPELLLRRLRADTLLQYLELPAIEQLATRVSQFAVSPGFIVVTEGNTDDGYYLIVTGSATVTRHGHLLAELGPGDSFGEIATLRSVPRSASVTATSTLDLLLVRQVDFLEAVNGHSWTLRTAHELVDDRLDP